VLRIREHKSKSSVSEHESPECRRTQQEDAGHSQQARKMHAAGTHQHAGGQARNSVHTREPHELE
jgi:hypothetical protein